MDKNNLLAGVIGLTIAIIVIASMVPTMLSSADNIKSIGTNTTEGTITYSLASDPEITISHGTSAIDVNGYELTPTVQTVLAACDDWCVFTYNTSDIFVLYDGGYDTVASTSNAAISNGTLTYTKSGGTEISKDVEGEVLYANNVNPTYVGYLRATTAINIDSGALLYFFGNPGLNNSDLTPSTLSPIAWGKGTADNLSYLGMNTAGVTSSTIALKSEPTETAGHYSIANAYAMSITNSTGTYTSDGSTYGTYVPITYDDVTSSDESMRNLIGIIPVLLIIAVLVMAVGLVSKSRA